MKINQLCKTYNYSQFRFANYNRIVDPKHVQQLVNEVKGGHPLLSPVIVNEKFEIIDGQHRLEALKRLKEPVEYIVRPGAAKSDVVSINNSQVRWRPITWIESYANAGNKNYQFFLNFLQNHKGYKWPIFSLEDLLPNPISTEINHHIHIEDVKFEVDYEHVAHAEQIVNDAALLKEKCGKKSSKSVVRVTIEALKILETRPDFKFNELLSKTNSRQYEQITSTCSLGSQAALKFLEIYNSRKRENKILAHIDAHGKFVFEN